MVVSELRGRSGAQSRTSSRHDARRHATPSCSVQPVRQSQHGRTGRRDGDHLDARSPADSPGCGSGARGSSGAPALAPCPTLVTPLADDRIGRTGEPRRRSPCSGCSEARSSGGSRAGRGRPGAARSAARSTCEGGGRRRTTTTRPTAPTGRAESSGRRGSGASRRSSLKG